MFRCLIGALILITVTFAFFHFREPTPADLVTRSISTPDHIIDFFVITLADLMAAGIAYLIFEKRQKVRDEERFKQQERFRKVEGRLETLSKMTSPVSTWVDARIVGFKSSDDNSSTSFSSSEAWNPWTAAFVEIKDDPTFWIFHEGKAFKELILEINEELKKVMESRSVGAAKASLREARAKLDNFQRKVTSALE